MSEDIKLVKNVDTLTEDSVFWDEFVKNTWEKKRKIVPHNIAASVGLVPPVLPEDLFKMVLKGIVEWTKSDRALIETEIRFFMDGHCYFNSNIFNRSKSDINQILDYLPKAEDENFDGYDNRLKQQLKNKGDNYILIVEPVAPSPAFRNWLYGLMNNVYTRLGYITTGSYMSTFYGNYDKTPFGAHVHDDTDECEGAFFFSIQGEKKMRTWADDFVQTIPEHPNFDPNQSPTLNYEPFNNESSLMSIVPGQAMYWTADTWHVAENQSSAVIAFPVAVKVADDITSSFLKDTLIAETLSIVQVKFISSILDIHVEREQDLLLRETKYGRLSIIGSNLQEIAQVIPIEIEAIAKQCKAIFSEDHLELIKIKFWLKTLSSYGIAQELYRNQSKVVSLSFSDTIRLYQNIPLLWREHNLNMLIAVTGKLVSIDNGAPKESIRKMIEILNTKKAVKISQLVETSLLEIPAKDREINNNNLLSILQSVFCWDVFEIN